MLGDVEVDDPSAVVGEDDQDEDHAQAVGTVKKSRAARSRPWLARNGRQIWDGGVCRMLGLEFRAARSPLFQDGMGLGPLRRP
jgi:hypothetical protein